jgi:non-homologous end joining protein Ku
MIEEKQKGQKITVAPTRPAVGPVIDLMDALKRSMRETQVGRAKDESKHRKIA